jgi:hypothetical protein
MTRTRCFRSRFSIGCVCIVLAIAAPCVADPAAEAIQPANERFATLEGDETPQFQRHVLPLLSRLGCNGRACHGSFQGQGGFRLSLFGYDFAADLTALTAGDKPRVDLTQSTESLILQKPTLAIDHEGGERFKPDGWEYHLLHRWIVDGAVGRKESAAELLRLEIEPREIIFATAGKSTPIRVTAIWSDDSREDITPLCRFRSNDESIATVTKEGVIAAQGRGDTHVIAFYDNGIAAVPVILPVSEQVGKNYPQVPTPTEVDRLVVQKLQKVGLVPSEVCSDAEFLRRLSLDMTATLPSPAEVAAFLADQHPDKHPDKRERKIDELLGRPTYAAWMTTLLCDWTGNTEQNLPVGGEQRTNRDKSILWYDWLYRRVNENVPYDELVAGIVLAVSRKPDQSDEDYYAEISAYFREKDTADFSQSEFMPYFWTPGRFSPSQTLRMSYAFLGVRLECAECHKHPYDQWTQTDYEDFQLFFTDVRFRQTGMKGPAKEIKEKLQLTEDSDSGSYKRLFASLAHEGQVLPWGEVRIPDWQKRRQPKPDPKNPQGRVFTPRLLGGEEVIAERYSDPREPVMDWLRDPQNPYFARTLVNRVWANYFGVGMIDPPDDMNLANPASNEPLLDYLAKEFIAHNYDLKWLHKEIASSRTYQLSWLPNSTNQFDDRNFTRAQVRRLPAEVTYDAMQFATAGSELQQQLTTTREAVRQRQIGPLHSSSKSASHYALKLFGKPDRQAVCDCQRSNEPSLLQTIYVRNDAEVLELLDRKGGWLNELKTRDVAWLTVHRDELVNEAWRRTFGRPPRPKELDIGRETLGQADQPLDGLKELLWALLNSKEFILNH